MTHTQAAAVWIARGWTRLYTSGLDRTLRDTRRAEIESDLWESHEDARRNGHAATEVALQMLARVLLGVPHDLLWALEHRPQRRHPLRRVALIAAAAAVFLAAAWVMSMTQAAPLPAPPSSMVFIAIPPPPPPPPPPPLPSSMAGDDGARARPAVEPPRR